MTLRERWAAANPASRALHERAARALPGGLAHDVRRGDPFPLAVVRCEGSRKWDADGHELVDYVMGHGSLLFGHAHPPVVEAVRAQAGAYLHAGACHELEAAWAEQVIRLVPCAELVRFTSSGTEATLLALQVARAATGRPRVLKLLGHFHGWHDYAALGVDPPFVRTAVPGVPDDVAATVTVVPANAAAVADELAVGDVAALILEPSGAAWGAMPLSPALLAQLRETTRAAGTLLVFDEVVTGFRWAPGGVQQLTGVVPDLTALAKVLGGGLPGGAVAGRRETMELLGPAETGRVKVHHPGTHNAHPLSAAAGRATLALLGDGAVQATADAPAARLREALAAVLQRHGVPGLVHGSSSTFIMLLGTEGPLDRLDPATLKRGTSGTLADELHCGMLLEGVHLFHACGFVGTAHTDADLERTVAALDAVVPQLQAQELL